MDNRELIVRAVTDLGFRKKLEVSPQEALGLPKFTDQNKEEVRRILSGAAQIEDIMNSISDTLLCQTPPPW